MSIHWVSGWIMENENVGYADNRILFNSKGNWNSEICQRKDGSGKWLYYLREVTQTYKKNPTYSVSYAELSF